MTGLTQAQAAIDAKVAELGKQWSVELDLPATPRAPYPTLRPRTRPPGPQPTNSQVIDHLAGMGRDVFALTEADRQALTSSLVGRYRDGLRGAALYVTIASSWRDRVVERMRSGATADPVSPGWAARKTRLGFPTTASIASGQLVRAIQSAFPRVRKIR